MSRLTCRFCAHANPERARFCNECGSQIDLKPCRRCDAVNSVNASACHECGTVFADRSEPLLAAADSGATSHGDTAINVEHAPVPEWFAQSIDASPKPVSVFVHSPEADRVGAIVGQANADLPAVALPAVVETAIAQRIPADRSGDFDARTRRRSAQGAALLGLAFAIAGGAYWVHRPSTAPEDRSVQRGVIAFTQPADSMPAEPTVERAVVRSQSALAVPSPSLDDEAFESKASQVTSEESTAVPIVAEAPSQPAGVLDAPLAQSPAVKRSVPSTVASGTRKPLTSRAYEAPASPVLWPGPASSPGERACTQAVAALGLCDSQGSR